jgi:hypothetical protein
LWLSPAIYHHEAINVTRCVSRRTSRGGITAIADAPDQALCPAS